MLEIKPPGRVGVVLESPPPTGFEPVTFHALRKIRRDVRVVLSSGYREEATSERFSRLGLAGFIHKPYQFDTMIAKLRGAVAGGKGESGTSLGESDESNMPDFPPRPPMTGIIRPCETRSRTFPLPPYIRTTVVVIRFGGSP
jgi:hypothetical protein